MPITKPAVWCPARDGEFIELAADMIYWFGAGMHNQALWGGMRQLGQLDAAAKLYIMAHWHSQVSKFSMGNLAWSGDELAAMLQTDGLSTAHRDIELVVCNAGSSAGSQATVARFREIQAEVSRAVRRQDQAAIKAAVRKYEAFNARPRPGPERYTRPRQQVPVAGDLFMALYERGYTSMVITAYLRPVAMVFSQKLIEIDVPPVKPAQQEPKLAVKWRV